MLYRIRFYRFKLLLRCIDVIIRNIMMYNTRLFCNRSQQKRYKGPIEGRTFISPEGFFLERFFDEGRKCTYKGAAIINTAQR